MIRILFSCLLLSFPALAQLAEPELEQVSVTPVRDGADLLTFYRGGIPQLAILRDTLNNPDRDVHRLRQVWMLTYARPTWKQRMAAAVPFFYHRAGRNLGPSVVPSPLFDLSQPAKGTIPRAAETLLQWSVFDSYGALLRAPTRAYRGNSLDSRNMALSRARDIVEGATSSDTPSSLFAGDDWDEVRGRLLVAPRLLGGFVSGERAEKAARQDRTRDLEDRAANWDLLRQSAEANDLYVEPLELSETAPQHAVLWFAQRAMDAPHFEPGFLNISDPFRDARLKQWTGYADQWSLDADGAVLSTTPAADAAELTRMIPLAVYALDYPRVPLLLIDFRSDRARRREVIRRTADDLASGVFGLTPYSSLSWFAARNSYIWVRDRHGAAFNRSLRLSSYARLRQTLLDDRDRLKPDFHQLLESKLDQLALNPFEQGTASEVELANRQYDSLLRWADDPAGLAATLDRDRAQEYFRQHHGAADRLFLNTLSLATFRTWKPYRPITPDALSGLERERRLESSRAPETALPSQHSTPPAISLGGGGQ